MNGHASASDIDDDREINWKEALYPWLPPFSTRNGGNNATVHLILLLNLSIRWHYTRISKLISLPYGIYRYCCFSCCCCCDIAELDISKLLLRSTHIRALAWCAATKWNLQAVDSVADTLRMDDELSRLWVWAGHQLWAEICRILGLYNFNDCLAGNFISSCLHILWHGHKLIYIWGM